MDARGKIVLWVSIMCVMALIGWGVAVYVGERHAQPLGVSPVQSKSEMAAVVAKFGTPQAKKFYKIKKTINVMGMNVIRVEHRQYPQEFVVVNDLSHDFVSDVFDQKMDPSLMESMFNEALKLKSGKDTSMDIRKMDIQGKGELTVNGKSLPYRKVRIVFKLSNEEEPRAYEGGMVREAGANSLDTLVVSFTRAPLEQADMLTADRPETDASKTDMSKATPAAKPAKAEGGMKLTLSKPPNSKSPRPVKTAVFKPQLLDEFMRTLSATPAA